MTSEGLTRMKRLKVNKAVVDMANNFNLGVNEDELRSPLTNEE